MELYFALLIIAIMFELLSSLTNEMNFIMMIMERRKKTPKDLIIEFGSMLFIGLILSLIPVNWIYYIIVIIWGCYGGQNIAYGIYKLDS